LSLLAARLGLPEAVVKAVEDATNAPESGAVATASDGLPASGPVVLER
jgi:hypothetical protein